MLAITNITDKWNRGHSAVRLSVLNTLIQFISEGITPIVPLRGSISASGDLSPLSYIAGAITGHPDVKVIIRK
jgi:phenylalanine ammonia-lyase